MAGGRVPPALAREREVRAWDFACQGKSQAYIAEQLGVSQPAVCQILKRVTTRALKRLEREVEQRKAIHTARLESIFAEALEAWHKSKEPRRKSSQKKLTTALTPGQLADARDGKPITLPVREELRNEASTTEGNFLYLQTALQADAELRKLWGLNAAKKIDLLDKRRPLEKLTDDELAERARENAALLAAEGARV